MSSSTLFAFGPFTIDLVNETLWQGSGRLTLKPKSFAVLRSLVERPQQLVTKDELINTHWGDVAVGDAVLKTCIGEIRQALGEQASHPQFIETVHRRGYRFLATPTTVTPQTGSTANTSLVGREKELKQLHQWWEHARKGERQIVFVTGEPGIGKTSLVKAFLERVSALNAVWIGRGQCIEQYGAGEAYLPVLEAIGRLCRQPGGEVLVTCLRQHAPTWLMHLPGLVDPEEIKELLPAVIGSTPVRMIRELADALEVFTQDTPLLVSIEDLHWLDTSSLDWLTYVARRADPARLLIIGTYRPTDLILSKHPLKGIKHELQLHEHCRELEVECLTEEAVKEFLENRVADKHEAALSVQTVAHIVHQRTEGNPLFMVNVVDYLMHHKLLVPGNQEWHLRDEAAASAFPAGLRQFINLRVEQLNPEDQQLLVMGSLTGIAFTTATIAAVLESNMSDIDQRLHELARREQFIRMIGIQQWTDGTKTAEYEFHHALYQETLYDQMSEAQQAEGHKKIGERLEQGYGEQARIIAAELALHFDRGNDSERASRYHQMAGENAFKRSAHQQAILHLTKSLKLLKRLPPHIESITRELTLQSTLGIQYMQTKHFAAPEVGQAFGRAWELYGQLPHNPRLFPILYGLCRFYFFHGNNTKVRHIVEHLSQLANEDKENTTFRLISLTMQGAMALYHGKLHSADDYLEQCLALRVRDDPKTLLFTYGEDPGIAARIFQIFTLWTMGFVDQALVLGEHNVSRARKIGNPSALAHTLLTLTHCRSLRGERQCSLPIIDEIIVLTQKHGLTQCLNEGLFLREQANATSQPIQDEWPQSKTNQDLLRKPEYRALTDFYHISQAETFLYFQEHYKGLELVTARLSSINETGNRWMESGFTQLRGEFILGLDKSDKGEAAQEVEACFREAIKLAKKQEAKIFELRAVMSLCRLWQQQGKDKQARTKLKKIYDWFTEGFDTKDLQEAKALLEDLR